MPSWVRRANLALVSVLLLTVMAACTGGSGCPESTVAVLPPNETETVTVNVRDGRFPVPVQVLGSDYTVGATWNAQREKWTGQARSALKNGTYEGIATWWARDADTLILRGVGENRFVLVYSHPCY